MTDLATTKDNDCMEKMSTIGIWTFIRSAPMQIIDRGSVKMKLTVSEEKRNEDECTLSLTKTCVTYSRRVFNDFLFNDCCASVNVTNSKMTEIIFSWGWRVGSVVRTLDWRSKGRGFESRQEHKKNFEFFLVRKVVQTRCRCAQPLVYTHHVRTLKIL